MEKLFAIILSICLFSSLSVTTFAATIDEDSSSSSADVTVTTSIEPTYTVTIPANTSVTFNTLSTSFGAVRLDAAQLEPGYVVRVELNASGTLKNAADNDKTIAYTIKDSSSNIFTAVQYTTAEERTDLTIDITKEAWNTAYAGSYSDTVVFTVSYIYATRS